MSERSNSIQYRFRMATPRRRCLHGTGDHACSVSWAADCKPQDEVAGGWVRDGRSPAPPVGDCFAAVIVREDESRVRIISRAAADGSGPPPSHDDRVHVFEPSRAAGGSRTVTVRQLVPTK